MQAAQEHRTRKERPAQSLAGSHCARVPHGSPLAEPVALIAHGLQDLQGRLSSGVAPRNRVEGILKKELPLVARHLQSSCPFEAPEL